MKPARRAVLVATLLMLIGPQPQGWAGDGGPIVVIVNQANPVPNLTVADLRKIFLSDRSRWETGKSVAPVIPPAGSPERSLFLKIVCRMSDAEFSKYFVQAAFTGRRHATSRSFK